MEIKGPSFGAIKIDTGAFLRRKVALLGLSKISKITLGAPKMTFWGDPSWGASWGVKNMLKMKVLKVNLESFLYVFGVFFNFEPLELSFVLALILIFVGLFFSQR